MKKDNNKASFTNFSYHKNDVFMGHQEYLVDFLYKGKKVTYVHLVRGTNNLNACKKEIESKIKDGSLERYAKWFIRKVNGKPPIWLMPLLITSAVVIAGTSVGVYYATNANNGQVGTTLKVELINSNCNVTGLKETYKYNEGVSLHIDPVSDLYYRPLASNLGVYGINKFNYNEDNGDLTFKITNNVTLDVKADPKYGKEVNRTEFSALFGADPLGEAELEPKRGVNFSTYEFWWDFSTVSKESTKIALFAELAKLGLVTTELSGYHYQPTPATGDEPVFAYSYAYNEEGFNAEFPDVPTNRYFVNYGSGVKTSNKSATAILNQSTIFEGHPPIPLFATFRISKSVSDANGTLSNYEVRFDNYEFSDDIINGYLKFKGGW